MKQLLVVLAIGFLVPAASAQKVAFTNKVKIENAQVGTIQKKGKTFQHVKLSSLKTGQNYLTLKSGNVLYIEVSAKKIKSLTLAKANGMQSGRIAIASKGLQFNCSGLLCACRGDLDCNDMFTTGVCGDAICIDDVCICVRNAQ